MKLNNITNTCEPIAHPKNYILSGLSIVLAVPWLLKKVSFLLVDTPNQPVVYCPSVELDKSGGYCRWFSGMVPPLPLLRFIHVTWPVAGGHLLWGTCHLWFLSGPSCSLLTTGHTAASESSMPLRSLPPTAREPPGLPPPLFSPRPWLCPPTLTPPAPGPLFIGTAPSSGRRKAR